MALKLIRRGAETVRLVPDKGTGWKNCLRPGNTSPYMGGVFMAVQATGCDGLRLIDWGGDRPDVEVTTGAVKAAQMVGNINTVIRVLNPTDKTEVIMHVVPIPPPCFVEVLRALRGGCRGAETRRHVSRRGGVHAHRRNGVAHPHGQKPDMGDSRNKRCNTRTGHLPHRGATECCAVQPLTVGERGQHHNPCRGGVFRGEETVLRPQWGVENHPAVATVAAGGGGGVNGVAENRRANQTPVGQRAPGRDCHDGCVAPTLVPQRRHRQGLPVWCGGPTRSARPIGIVNGVPAVHLLPLGRRVLPGQLQRPLGKLEAPAGYLAAGAVV